MTMPPAPKPTQASELASAGTDRKPAVSAAIGLSATMMIHGAPKDSARIASTTTATIQEALVSTDCTFIRSCIRGWGVARDGSAGHGEAPAVADLMRDSLPRDALELDARAYG